MRKLRLELESLEVCSFEIAVPEREDGTVRGNYLDSKADCDSTRVARDCYCTRYCTETCPTDGVRPICINPID